MIDCMTENLAVSASEAAAADFDEFYVRRVNWLVEVGRSDVIDEIADDCERRRPAARSTAPTPNPVETGTRLAVAELRRSRRATLDTREPR
jgi:hypothetical protein